MNKGFTDLYIFTKDRYFNFDPTEIVPASIQFEVCSPYINGNGKCHHGAR